MAQVAQALVGRRTHKQGCFASSMHALNPFFVSKFRYRYIRRFFCACLRLFVFVYMCVMLDEFSSFLTSLHKRHTSEKVQFTPNGVSVCSKLFGMRVTAYLHWCHFFSECCEWRSSMDTSLSRHRGALRERAELIASVLTAEQRPNNIYTANAHEPAHLRNITI
jgi:hypothetical protein